MMGRRAFILLKVGYGRPETAKQAETRMADLPTILRILGARDKNSRRPRVTIVSGKNLRRIWLIRPDSFFCYLDHSLSPEIGAVSPRDVQDKDKESIGVEFYTVEYARITDFGDKLTCISAE